MKKWITAVSLSACGLAIFLGASVMAGRFDEWQVAEANGLPAGQFNGGGRAILHLLFLWLLACAWVVGMLAFGIAALAKWRGYAFARTTYGTLYYWWGFMPIVAYMVMFPVYSLWGTMKDYVVFMK